jgi:SAM-dependent methyltransferase
MEPPSLTDAQREEIHAQKRAVWAQKGAGKHYHHLAHQNDPVTRLKNLTELGYVLRHVSGPKVLDAGAGTGRFTFSLREAGHTATALDISLDMLRQGRKQGAELGRAFPCLQGEIERLPFSDGTFDGVVSMTVLRHFPNWMELLDEYVRVIRDGGRIIFDMASGEQQEFGDSVGLSRPHLKDGFQPLEFDAGVTFGEMQTYASSRGLGIAAYQPHDFFNGNPVLEHVLGQEREAFMGKIKDLLERDEVIRFCEMVHRRFLPALSPAVCGSVLIVLEKHPETEFAPTNLPNLPAEHDETSESMLLRLLERSLGRRYRSFMREASRHMEAPGVREFVSFCRQQLLARWPVATLEWQSRPPREKGTIRPD